MAEAPDAPPAYRAHYDLIHALGGPTAVSDLVRQKTRNRLTPQGVVRWYSRGVAWRYRPLLVQHAVERGVSVPPGFLDSTQPTKAAA